MLRKNTTRLQEDDPVWSPDGRRIAYEGWTGYGQVRKWIYTMNPDGTHRRRLAFGGGPEWSPDGRRIAYTGEAGIYVMSADGTGKQLLADGWGPSWSPDGKQIAFTRDDPFTNGDVYVMNADGGGERRLTRIGDNEVAAWAPGRTIAFVHDPFNGGRPANGVYVIKADGTGLRRVERASRLASPEIDGWSPDGQLLLYVAEHGFSTWRVSDGSVRRIKLPNDAQYPAWEPGSRQIAFARNEAGRDGIWIANRDGSAAHRIASVTNPDFPHFSWYWRPAWAPR